MILAAVFATYYVALSLTQQEGPFRVFERFRNLFVVDNWLGRGVRCVVCVSLYAAVGFACLLAYGGLIMWYEVLIVAPALAGGAVTVAHSNERRR